MMVGCLLSLQGWRCWAGSSVWHSVATVVVRRLLYGLHW